MELIGVYYELKQGIAFSDYKIKLFQNNSKGQRLSDELKFNSALKGRFERLSADLSQTNEIADTIRQRWVKLCDDYTIIIGDIVSIGNYPSLKQGTIKSDFILGVLLSNFKNSMLYNGRCVLEIFWSHHQWPVEELLALLKSFRSLLAHTSFVTRMDAISHFEVMMHSVTQLSDYLRKTGHLLV